MVFIAGVYVALLGAIFICFLFGVVGFAAVFAGFLHGVCPLLWVYDQVVEGLATVGLIVAYCELSIFSQENVGVQGVKHSAGVLHEDY